MSECIDPGGVGGAARAGSDGSERLRAPGPQLRTQPSAFFFSLKGKKANLKPMEGATWGGGGEGGRRRARVVDA